MAEPCRRDEATRSQCASASLYSTEGGWCCSLQVAAVSEICAVSDSLAHSSLVLYAYTSQAVIEAWDDGIGRLVNAGVTGTILLANMASVKGLAVRTTPSSASAYRCVWIPL